MIPRVVHERRFEPQMEPDIRMRLYARYPVETPVKRIISFSFSFEEQDEIQLDWSHFQTQEPAASVYRCSEEADALIQQQSKRFQDGDYPKNPMLEELMKLYWTGQYFLVFSIGVTFLEHILCHQCHENQMLLKDILVHPNLLSVLPKEALGLLQELFLPRRLNLRNLIWHGFLSPIEFPRRFASLLLCLFLPSVLFDSQEWFDRIPLLESPNSLWTSLFDFDSQWTSFEEPCCAFKNAQRPKVLVEHEHDDHHNIMTLFLESPFAPQDRSRHFQRGWRYCTSGYELLGLFHLLPILEHLVRIAFSVLHDGPARFYRMANTSEYYSTLDGHGQRHKHQLLFDSEVRLTQAPNTLCEILPPGVLALCRDLFNSEYGPSFRANICHGRLDWKSIFTRETSRNSTSKINAHFLAAFHSLLLYLQKTEIQTTADSTRHWTVSYVSRFHPREQFKTLLCRSVAAHHELERLRAKCEYRIISPKDDDDDDRRMATMAFPSLHNPFSNVMWTIQDKASRLLPDRPNFPQSLPSLIHFQLQPRVRAVLVDHKQTSELLWCTRAQQCGGESTIRECEEEISRCDLEILRRYVHAMQQWQNQWQDLLERLEDGRRKSPSTSVRRKFCNTVLFSRCFMDVLLVLFAWMVQLPESSVKTKAQMLNFVQSLESHVSSPDKSYAQLIQLALVFLP